MKNNFDVVIIGAGSIGVPLSYYLSLKGLNTAVIDRYRSPGQGSNKAAIGGIRATHSNRAKIKIGLKSLEIFKAWEGKTGDDIEWYEGGYSFVTYREKDAVSLRELTEKQKALGLDINFLDGKQLLKKLPHLNPHGLLGGTLSPHDGSASPLLFVNSIYKQAVKNGAKFFFNESVIGFKTEHGEIEYLETDKNKYSASLYVNASGAFAADIGKMLGIDIPVMPESHEAGVTEPVAHFIDPLVVDIRPANGSANFYFYQHKTGQIIFCLTPSPNIPGYDVNETSVFLPQVARRMIEVMPMLANIRVRRTWRGLYPMTQDGNPIVGYYERVSNMLHVVGMCGQGFMLGPGLAYYLSRHIAEESVPEAKDIFSDFSPSRNFEGEEKLK